MLGGVTALLWSSPRPEAQYAEPWPGRQPRLRPMLCSAAFIVCLVCCWAGVKTVRIFSDRIRDRIRIEEFKSVRIRVQIFNIRYRIRIQIIKSHIYDVDIQSYPIRHGWQYPYSNPNPDRNMKTNVISVISVRIRSVFIPGYLLLVSIAYKSVKSL